MKQRQLAELLGRPQRAIHSRVFTGIFEGRRVLVTGAGGSIGTELAIRIAQKGNPARLTLLNHSELALYHAHRGISWGRDFVNAHLVDVRDADHVKRVFAEEQPDVVFHAAAMKHVPLCEENPDAAVATNVQGTWNVALACVGVGADLVFISTDKAVNPNSVMGRTKRLAEHVVASWPSFRTVRFGNVLGSSGSVLPLFKEQLARGNPLTVTHPDVARYFMTLREAVGLTLAAVTLPGRLFVLDMGEPVRIADLARRFADLTTTEHPIVFTGLRPGEKLTEELFYPEEHPRPTDVPGVLRARPCERYRDLTELLSAARDGRTAETLRLLQVLAP